MIGARSIIHLLLHFAVPGVVAWFGFRGKWKSAWFIMVMTMMVDLDHLLADPNFDPNRCGIGFHPLHSYPAIAVYASMLLVPKLRVIAVGLLIHMMLDALDCLWIFWNSEG